MCSLEEVDSISVHRINAGDGDGADILLDFNGQRISVSIFPSAEHNVLEDRLIQLLGQATITEDDDEYEAIEDQVLNSIFKTGLAALLKVAPSGKLASQSDGQDLHSLLYPPIFTFGLKTIDGNVTIAPIQPNETYTELAPTLDPEIEQDFDIDISTPQYSSKEVIVLQNFVRGANSTVSRVLINGQEMVCRAHKDGLLDSMIEKELVALRKIRDACQADHPSAYPVHATCLLGYVRHCETNDIIGILRKWVPGERLSKLDIPATPMDRRQKWALQIRQAVNQLHKLGVVWGDGKAGNVIVDEHDEAWLIDFGGGWTDGWVDEELAGTVVGDEQAVRKIFEFLQVA